MSEVSEVSKVSEETVDKNSLLIGNRYTFYINNNYKNDDIPFDPTIQVPITYQLVRGYFNGYILDDEGEKIGVIISKSNSGTRGEKEFIHMESIEKVTEYRIKKLNDDANGLINRFVGGKRRRKSRNTRKSKKSTKSRKSRKSKK